MSQLTKEEIFEAANKLAAKGVMPSILNVRRELGDRGSESTLQKYLKEWKRALLLGTGEKCVYCAKAARDNQKLNETLANMTDDLRKSILSMLGSEPFNMVH